MMYYNEQVCEKDRTDNTIFNEIVTGVSAYLFKEYRDQVQLYDKVIEQKILEDYDCERLTKLKIQFDQLLQSLEYENFLKRIKIKKALKSAKTQAKIIGEKLGLIGIRYYYENTANQYLDLYRSELRNNYDIVDYSNSDIIKGKFRLLPNKITDYTFEELVNIAKA